MHVLSTMKGQHTLQVGVSTLILNLDYPISTWYCQFSMRNQHVLTIYHIDAYELTIIHNTLFIPYGILKFLVPLFFVQVHRHIPRAI